jgi:uncharacterized protein
MNFASNIHPAPKRFGLRIAAIVAIGAALTLWMESPKIAWMFVVALIMGIALYHASFGFSAAYRKLFRQGDVSGVSGQLILLGLTTLFFAPFLSTGTAFGTVVGGAVAPVGLGMAFGALIFGIGMQLSGACASGTLYTVGSGNPKMIVVLLFFCAGAFWGSLDLIWWQSLPSLGSVSLAEEFGWAPAVGGQILLLVILYLLLRRFGRLKTIDTPLTLTVDRSFLSMVTHGPWPLIWGALALALLNWVTLVSAGHPWSITWGFTLWGGKIAQLFGWDPITSGFWADGFPARALSQSIFADTTSVMNMGILGGAFLGMTLAGRKTAPWNRKWRPILAASIGGLMLGYGARLAYGCNIGAFISGAASTSLHGWVWILCALPGNWIGMHFRKLFHLEN